MRKYPKNKWFRNPRNLCPIGQDLGALSDKCLVMSQTKTPFSTMENRTIPIFDLNQT